LDWPQINTAFPKCIHISKSVGKCKNYRPKTKMN
jgi:hypothetical protein